MSGLHVSHLHKQYGTFTAVSDVSLHIDRGEIVGLLGPNGAGKSTMMKLVMGLMDADDGSVAFDDEVYNGSNSEMRSRFGFVPQNLAIYPELTAIQNLRFFGQLNGVFGKRLKERVDFVLSLTGLADNSNHFVSTFSGGMSRRLNFGIALLHEPQFVLLDEPTVGIDPQSRTNLLDGVKELCDHGAGVLYASHYMEEVETLCDRVVIMDHGHTIASGTMDELLGRSPIDLVIEVESLSPDARRLLEPIATVQENHPRSISITVHQKQQSNTEEAKQLRQVLEILENTSTPIFKIVSREQSLESLFLELTGRRLRD